MAGSIRNDKMCNCVQERAKKQSAKTWLIPEEDAAFHTHTTRFFSKPHSFSLMHRSTKQPYYVMTYGHSQRTCFLFGFLVSSRRESEPYSAWPLFYYISKQQTFSKNANRVIFVPTSVTPLVAQRKEPHFYKFVEIVVTLFKQAWHKEKSLKGCTQTLWSWLLKWLRNDSLEILYFIGLLNSIVGGRRPF